MSYRIDETTVKFLKERLSSLNAIRKKVIDSIKEATDEEQKIKTEPLFGKYKYDESLITRINNMEHDLVVNSYSIQETKEITRKIDKLRQDELLGKQQRLWNDAIMTIREKKRGLFVRLNEVRHEINEVDIAMCIAWTIIYNREQGHDITPDQITSEPIAVKDDIYYSFYRTHLNYIRRFERDHCICLLYNRNQASCMIYGLSTVLPTLKPIVADFFTWQIQRFPAVLLAKEGKYAHMFESLYSVIIHINKDAIELQAEGGQQALTQFEHHFNRFFSQTKSISLSSYWFSELANHHNPSFYQVIMTCPCYCSLDYNLKQLQCYGTEADIEESQKQIQLFIQSNASCKEIIKIDTSDMISFLIGSHGKKAKELESYSHCHCQFSKTTESPTITLNGQQHSITLAKQWIERELTEYAKQNAVISIPELGIPILLNNKGIQLQSIQNQTKARITIKKASCQCLIQGKETNVKLAIAMIQDVMSCIIHIQIPLSSYNRGAFLGVKGRNIEHIRQTCHVSLRCEDDVICIEGYNKNVKQAENSIKTWLKQHCCKELIASREAIGVILIGSKGSKVKQIEKQYGIHVFQDDNQNDLKVVIQGNESNVLKAYKELSALLHDYDNTHCTYQLTSNHFIYSIACSYHSINTMRSQFPTCTITVIKSLGQLRCSGDVSSINQFKAYFDPLFEQWKNESLHVHTIEPSVCGLIIGKNGLTIHQLQKDYNVSLQIDNTTGQLTIWGNEQQFELVKKEIDRIIETKQIVKESICVTSDQLNLFLVDKCRCLSEIQTETSTQIQLPTTQSNKIVTISGSKQNVKKASILVQLVLKGIYTYHYTYPSDSIIKLKTCPTFHIERIIVSTHCKIDVNDSGSLVIRGEYNAIHKAHQLIYEGLTMIDSSHFDVVSLDKGCCYYLLYNSIQWNTICPNVTIEVEIAEHSIYVFGETANLNLCLDSIKKQIAIIASEHVILSVDTDLIKHVVGMKGKKIKEIMATSGAIVEVLQASNELYVHGESSNVQNACDMIDDVINNFNELNVQLPVSCSVLTQFVDEYGSLIKRLELQHHGEISIQKKKELILIKGKTPEGTRDLRFVVESMLEVIELKQEMSDIKEKEIETEVDEHEGDSQKQEIASLLGLNSL